MNVTVNIIDGPLAGRDQTVLSGAGLPGAVLCFEGIVRGMEDGRPLAALEYEVYEPMTTRELDKLARAIIQEHGLLAIHVEHSRGIVPVGQCSFRLRIASAHRKQALAAMDAFIDRMKREVPIWKQPVWSAGVIV